MTEKEAKRGVENLLMDIGKCKTSGELITYLSGYDLDVIASTFISIKTMLSMRDEGE